MKYSMDLNQLFGLFIHQGSSFFSQTDFFLNRRNVYQHLCGGFKHLWHQPDVWCLCLPESCLDHLPNLLLSGVPHQCLWQLPCPVCDLSEEAEVQLHVSLPGQPGCVWCIVHIGTARESHLLHQTVWLALWGFALQAGYYVVLFKHILR